MCPASNNLEDEEQALHPAQELVRDVFFSKLRQVSCIEDIQISSFSLDEPIYAHNMAVILLHGEPIRFVVKVHYQTLDAKKMVAHRSSQPVDSISDQIVKDFMRETINVVAGSIKLNLLEQGIITGIGIPFVTKGFDELMFTDVVQDQEIHDSSVLYWDNGKIFLSTVVKIMQPELFENYQYNSADSLIDENEDGEFL